MPRIGLYHVMCHYSGIREQSRTLAGIGELGNEKKRKPAAPHPRYVSLSAARGGSGEKAPPVTPRY